jgi:hypothetical protein
MSPHKARVRRNHKRLPSSPLIERARSYMPDFTASAKTRVRFGTSAIRKLLAYKDPLQPVLALPGRQILACYFVAPAFQSAGPVTLPQRFALPYPARMLALSPLAL